MNLRKDLNSQPRKTVDREKAMRWAIDQDPRVMSNNVLLGILKDSGRAPVRKSMKEKERLNLASIENLVSPVDSPRLDEKNNNRCLEMKVNPSPCFGGGQIGSPKNEGLLNSVNQAKKENIHEEVSDGKSLLSFIYFAKFWG
jgi:hypothetical protein